MYTVSNYSPLHFNHVDNKKVFVYVRVCLFSVHIGHTAAFLLSSRIFYYNNNNNNIQISIITFFNDDCLYVYIYILRFQSSKMKLTK